MLRNGYNLCIFFLLALILFLLFLNSGNKAESAAYFLDVGRGESELIRSGRASILVDAGYGNQAASVLDKMLYAKYLDLGVVSELNADYLNGYNFLVQNYGLGALLWNGRQDANAPEWQALAAETKKRNIPMVPVSAGDIIRAGDLEIKIISPGTGFLKSSEPADSSLVLAVNSPGMLLAGGIGANAEAILSNSLKQEDILKVSAHAAKNSVSQKFLSAIKPKISIISTGPKTLPDPQAVNLLKSVNSLVFQTGLSGTIKITSQNGKLRIFTEK